MDNFSLLVLVRHLRPELFIEGCRELVEKELGDYFVKNLIISIEDSFEESTAAIPLLFILSPGDDPADSVKKLAQEK